MKKLTISTKILIGLLAGILTLGSVLFITMPDDFKKQVNSHINGGFIERTLEDSTDGYSRHSFSKSYQGDFRNHHNGGGIIVTGGLIFIGYLILRKKKVN